MAPTDSTTVGTFDGWTITEDADGVMEATKAGMRPIRCGGGPGTPRAVLREKVFEAMAEADGVAATGGGTAPAAVGGATVHAARIVVHDQEGR